METYDVIMLGGGPGGLTAGIYTARQGLKSLLFEAKQLGGRAWGPHKIENYPGFPSGARGRRVRHRWNADNYSGWRGCESRVGCFQVYPVKEKKRYLRIILNITIIFSR